MDTIIIRPTLKRRVSFKGELVSQHSTRALNNTRWNTATVYRTSGGNYALKVEHCTCWQGESDRVEIQLFETADEMVNSEMARPDGEYFSQAVYDCLSEMAETDVAIATAFTTEY